MEGSKKRIQIIILEGTDRSMDANQFIDYGTGLYCVVLSFAEHDKISCTEMPRRDRDVAIVTRRKARSHAHIRVGSSGKPWKRCIPRMHVTASV